MFFHETWVFFEAFEIQRTSVYDDVEPFSWAKPACFDFSSSNFTMQGHIVSTAGDALRLDIGQARLHSKSIQLVCDIRSMQAVPHRTKTCWFTVATDEGFLCHKLWQGPSELDVRGRQRWERVSWVKIVMIFIHRTCTQQIKSPKASEPVFFSGTVLCVHP